MASQNPTIRSFIDSLTPKQKVELVQRRLEKMALERGRVLWDPDPVNWITKHFWVPELKGPLQLHPYQAAVLREATRRDKEGKFIYSTVVWSDIKKSIKSTIAAARALWTGWGVDWGSTYIIANDLKQADSRVGYYMRRAIELNPILKASCQVVRYRITFPNHGFSESVAIDPSGEAGSNADLIVFSELWGAHQEAQQKMWTEMTLSPTKYGYSQRWVETYAGYSGESPLLEQLYQQGVNEGRRLLLPGAPKDLEVFANDSARLLVLWNTKPRLSWQTEDYYAQEAAVLTPSEFNRVHRNQWSSASGEFVPKEWWDKCAGIIPTITGNDGVVVGIDAGVASDCFAIVIATRKAGQVQVIYAKAWQPKPGHKLDFAGPEAELRRIAAEYNVLEFAYDQYQLHDMATRLSRKEGLGWFNDFSQGQQRMVADKNLYDLIRERRITHPNITVLNDHIQNANAQTDKEKMRIVKRAEHLKIDCAVALSMAAYETVRLNLG